MIILIISPAGPSARQVRRELEEDFRAIGEAEWLALSQEVLVEGEPVELDEPAAP